MADRSTERRWLEQLTALPTAPGHEDRVLAWVSAWVGRRSDLGLVEDIHGNLLITQKGRRTSPPVIAVAHTDHPGFVVTQVEGRSVSVDFRGGVRREYFQRARVELFDSSDGVHRGRLEEYDHDRSRGTVLLDRSGPLAEGDIGRWSFGSRRIGLRGPFAHAPACDDLAGVAAALAALDRARGDRKFRNFGVLLTRAEEVGFLGAVGACRDGTIPDDARVLSIECSRAFADSPLGGGPVVRVGDASSVFDNELTNRVSTAVANAGIKHQRHLMAGGSCEATAFLAYGYRATGLCLPLANYHNMGNLDEVERGQGAATPLPEVVSLDDYHGLVDLLAIASLGVDDDSDLKGRLDRRFESISGILG